MIKKSLFALITISALISSCSKYDKLLKSSDYELKYKKALEYFEKKDHYRYTTILEQIASVYKGTQRSDTIEFYLANGYYHQGDYLLAGHYFDNFRKNYPKSLFTEEAEFMYAYCYYKSSPRPLLDQETTNAAISSFLEFSAKYPRTIRKQEVDSILDELRNKLMEKSYLSSKLYFDTGDYKAAIVSLKNSLREYPNSSYREEQLYMVLQASYLLAENSVPSKRRERFQNTVDEYYTLVGEYPQSKYLNDAERIHANSVKFTGNQ